MKSTVWIAKERNGKSLTDFLKYLSDFYSKNIPITIKGEEEYEFSLHSLENKDNLHIGLLYKYKRDISIETYILNTRNDAEEKTHEHTILANAYFCIADELLMVEEKPPHFDHVMIARILDAMAEKVNGNSKYDFDFLSSGNAKDRMSVINRIFEQINEEKIKKIKFKDIRRNPDPTDKALKEFEDMATDTGSSDIEFSSPKKGLNHDSSYIEGGKRLAEENKTDIKIETETNDKITKTYDTSEANKERLEITYENDDDRPEKLLEAFKELLKSHKDK